MPHVVLLGDSIFDNAAYVPDGEPVIEQLRSRLDRGDRATLLAQDGAIAENVGIQMSRLPSDCTQVVISAGQQCLAEQLSPAGQRSTCS